MEEVKLLNRVDSKFVFRAGELPLLLGQMQPDYFVLEIDGVRLQHYDTLYFDTPDHRLYLNHHNKRANRFKVRSRRYSESGVAYFEIKFKTNKGRTNKIRNKQKGLREEIAGKQAELLREGTGMEPGTLQPALQIFFSRITLANRALTERVTIDTGLTFRNENGEHAYPGVVVAELKQDRNAASPLSALLHRHHIRPCRMSKYCIGLASVEPGLRQNNFKRKLRNLNKLNHDVC
jgi:hypothetical protein